MKAYKFNRIPFWLNPEKSGAPERRIITCKPEYYLNMANVTELVLSTIKRYAKKSDTILEIGCGTGRNLVALKKAGYRYVSGIELNPRAVEIGWEHFPTYKKIQVVIGAAEKVIDDVGDFDVIFTQGLLMHIPPEHEWLFDRISKKARKVIMTNEGELKRKITEHAWNRDYKVIFEALGWKEVEMETGDKYPPLPATTIKRVFVKPKETIFGLPVVESDDFPPIKDGDIVLGTYDDLGHNPAEEAL